MPRDISQCITPAERMILPSETSATPSPCWVLRLATRLLIWPAFPRRCHAKGRRSGTKRHQPSLGRISIVPAGDGHFPPLLFPGLPSAPQYALVLCAGTIHTCPSVCRRGTVAELRELQENLLVEAEKVRACLTALAALGQVAGALVQWSACRPHLSRLLPCRGSSRERSLPRGRGAPPYQPTGRCRRPPQGGPEGARPPHGLELVPSPPHPMRRSHAVELDSCPQVRLCASRSAPAAAARPCASPVSPPPPPPPSPPSLSPVSSRESGVSGEPCNGRQDAQPERAWAARRDSGAAAAGPGPAWRSPTATPAPATAPEKRVRCPCVACVVFSRFYEVTDVRYYTYTQLHHG